MSMYTDNERREPMKAFKLGDRVVWESQAQGSWKRKEGEVVEVVPAFGLPRLAGDGWGMHREHESYVVAVQTGKRKTTLKHYCPRVSALSAL